MDDFRPIARVRAVTDGGRRLYIELRNGNVGTVDADEPGDFHIGDVVFIGTDDVGRPRLDRAPREIWGDDPSVGVVRLKLPDVTVVDTGGRLRRLPTTAVEYEAGNTVEVGEFDGVLRVLDEHPVRYIDLPTIDRSAIERFRAAGNTLGLSYSDFGGLESVVARARELVELPLQRRTALNAIGARPVKGVLFTGDPGTGKTMLGKIIAAQADAVFYEISGPEIFSKWYGQSGEMLRRIFEAAKNEPSAIVFFDEIDSVAARRRDESHEESKRVVAQLLTLMDGFEVDANVIVIATTNRPDDIDPALRRPGRFDWEIHFPRPNADDRQAILEVAARRFATADDLPLDAVAARTAGWTGADLVAIWTEAGLLAVADGRDRILVEDLLGGFERVQQQRRDKGAGPHGSVRT